MRRSREMQVICGLNSNQPKIYSHLLLSQAACYAHWNNWHSFWCHMAIAAAGARRKSATLKSHSHQIMWSLFPANKSRLMLMAQGLKPPDQKYKTLIRRHFFAGLLDLQFDQYVVVPECNDKVRINNIPVRSPWRLSCEILITFGRSLQTASANFALRRRGANFALSTDVNLRK